MGPSLRRKRAKTITNYVQKASGLGWESLPDYGWTMSASFYWEQNVPATRTCNHRRLINKSPTTSRI